MGEFDFKPARRTGLKARIALVGPGGAGKTMTALLLASGIAPGALIAGIDSENKRMLEYADRFTFSHLDFRAPYSPDRYVKAIAAAESAVGPDGVIIVDSLSHAWIGKGGVLDIKAAAGADFSGWKKATPEQEKLMGAIMACGSHIICCMRVKVEYEMQERQNAHGRATTAPVKVGLAPVQRDGVDYEFSIVGSIDMTHTLTVTKASFDIMDLVVNKPGQDLGRRIRDWLDSSTEAPPDSLPAPEPVRVPVASQVVSRSSNGAAPAGVDEPAARGVAASAPSRVAHDAPFDPTPPESRGTMANDAPAGGTTTPTPASPVPAKAGPTPEQIRDGFREPASVPAEPGGEDWKRDESAVPLGSPTEQRNRILELAGHIGRADARDLAAATVGYDVSTLIVPELRSAADAAKVITALQNAWNDIQVERKQAQAVGS
jgi:AAA domain